MSWRDVTSEPGVGPDGKLYPWPDGPIVEHSPEEKHRERTRRHLTRDHGYRVKGDRNPYYSDPVALHADLFPTCSAVKPAVSDPPSAST